MSAVSFSAVNTMFAELATTYPTWSALKTFLESDVGGKLRVVDNSTMEDPFALIHYVKGQSNLALPHVRAFRSVIWDTMSNGPASVTPPKSTSGERIPSGEYTAPLVVEAFPDGVMLGLFYDKYNRRWRLHTRTTLDAECRYYSQDKTFATLFKETWDLAHPTLFEPKTMDLFFRQKESYTFILQHPENRIVVPVKAPQLWLVHAANITDKNYEPLDTRAEGALSEDMSVVRYPMASADAVMEQMRNLEEKQKKSLQILSQGIVVKNVATGERWKIRAAEYNRVHKMRGNTARRDFLWLSLWRSDALRDYLALYPEERVMANGLIEKWKSVTNAVFHIYTDVFKARTLKKDQIPPKFRTFVYGLHNLYWNTLKPASKTLDWKETLKFMNARDIPQMLFVLNWEVREASKQIGAANIPLESLVPSVGTVVAAEEENVKAPEKTVAEIIAAEATVPAPVASGGGSSAVTSAVTYASVVTSTA